MTDVARKLSYHSARDENEEVINPFLRSGSPLLAPNSGQFNPKKTFGNYPLAVLSFLKKPVVGKMHKTRIQILRDIEGLVKSREMLLVGCSTLLKTISGETDGLIVGSDSHLNYQDIPKETMHKEFRGECIYQAQIDIHFPQLTIAQTLDFAAHASVPRNRLPGVCNDFIRGVSDGERKRLSTAEVAIAGIPLQCWDNSTGVLDSATALEFIRTIRTSTEPTVATAILTLYQASQSTYDTVFNKVTVLYKGRQIYFGPIQTEKTFFISLGFECLLRQTTTDFLTSLTNPAEPAVCKGFKGKTPCTPTDFADAWRKSEDRARLLREIAEFDRQYAVRGPSLNEFKQSRKALMVVLLTQDRRVTSPYTLSLPMQLELCMRRGYQRLKGDMVVTVAGILFNPIMAFVIGSVFYNLPNETGSLYSRGALLFFTVLLVAFAFALEQAKYAFYHPFAEAIDIHQGKLEQASAVCHHFGYYHNVGLSAHYKLHKSSRVSALKHLIYSALADVIRKHPILSAIPVDEESPDAYFAHLPSIDFERSILFIERRQPLAVSEAGEDRELDTILQDQHNTNFKSEYGALPFWRLLILTTPGIENEFTASFIFHHAIGDGVSGLIFHNAFRDALEANSLSLSVDPKLKQIITPNDTPLLLPLEELHPLPIRQISTKPSTTILKEWTGNVIHAPCKSHYKTLYLSPSSSATFVQDCKKKNLSVTSALSSLIATVLFSILPPATESLTCIIPVNLRPWLKLECDVAGNAIGTYFDAFRVQFRRPDGNIQCPNSTDIWPGAHKTSREIVNYLGDLSPSGELYTAVAIFKAIPDVSVIFTSTIGKDRDAAFEVSNLGAFPSSIKAGTDLLWQLGRVTFSRSSVVSGSAVTLSIVSGGDGGLTMGFSWQDGVVEDSLVDSLIEGIGRYLEV
ncbi:uncharacterized protein A1O5_05363 [Cladophialophora psammophila CBS 110553]|uniref:Uncharacterized protein n=1 Tax=Cladophialophora psammophila CBS 110553 TaxID=1182543 RepID=W9X2L4_9EURO|nr:uncharacterized protein A1O5_05363 [Cladophialophora psammophila CBS 110553]EXJ71555.1 hypothetical protein A1O5_05363 [Cladophialophora psammophila CBS 110553]